MRKVRNKKLIYRVIILLLLTLGFSYGYLHSPTGQIQNATELNNEILNNTGISGPIYIDNSNSSYDWSVAKNAGICTGEGTISNPYIITDLIIEGNHSDIGIHIRDSVVYFIIKNCTISNNTNGIFFHDVENGLITNNTIMMNTNGIYLENSNYNNINKNLIRQNSNYGMYLRIDYSFNYVTHNNIVENIIKDNLGPGIHIYSYSQEAHHNNIINNTITNNINFGIRLFRCRSTTVINNLINNTTGQGIYNVGSYNSISDNTIINNTLNGIHSEGGSYLTINGNMVTHNYQNGLFISGNNYDYTVSNNNFSSNGRGGNFDGIVLDGGAARFGCWDNIFKDNHISYNTGHGLHLKNYVGRHDDEVNYGNNILNNTITRNTYHGVYINQFVTNTNFTRNKINQNNQFGVFINDQDSQKNLFFNNSLHLNIIGNALDNGSLNHWNNTDVGNYWHDYPGVDADDDGIGDTSYVILGTAGSVDSLPIWDDGDDDAPPSITIITPNVNLVYGKKEPGFQISTNSLYIDTMWYKIGGGNKNVTFEGSTGYFDQQEWEKVLNGTVIIEFYANDSLGNLGNTNIILKKDIIKPSLFINLPIPNEFFGFQSPNYNVSVDEPNLDSFWYTINEGETNITTVDLAGTIDAFEWGNLSSMIVTIIFYANDTAGNVGNSQISIVKDIDNPVITIFHPSQNEKFVSAPTYEISILESYLVNIWYTIDDGLNSYTISQLSGRINQSAWNNAQIGYVTIKFYARDTQGNIGYCEVLIEKIEKPESIPGYYILVIICLFGTVSGLEILNLLQKRKPN